MALPAGRYGVTKNQLLKIKKLPMNTIKLIEELTEKFNLLGTAAFKNSTSVVTQSTDLVESGTVFDALGFGNKNLFNYNGVNNVVIAQCKNGVTYTFSLTSTGHAGVNLKKNDNSGDVVTFIAATSEGRNSVTFTADSDFNLFMNGYGIGSVAFADDVSDLQLEKGSTATAYEPYHASVEDTLRNAEVVKGKNLLPVTLKGIKELNTSGTWSGNIYTLNDVALTIETDGDKVLGIDVNGTASYNIIFKLALPTGGDILTGCPTGGGWGSYILYQSGGATDSGEGATGVLTDSYISIYVKAGYNVQHKKFYPMIRKATETDPTYEPYYIPLKDVVPNKCDNSVIGTVEDGTNASKGWLVGEHFIKDGAFKEVTQPIASGGAISDSNTVNKPIADCLVKQATFSGTTSAIGALIVSTSQSRAVISAEVVGYIVDLYKRSEGYGAVVKTPQGEPVVETPVSGTYYYI